MIKQWVKQLCVINTSCCFFSGVKRPAGGGLGSVLNKISKKDKISTLVSEHSIFCCVMHAIYYDVLEITAKFENLNTYRY